MGGSGGGASSNCEPGLAESRTRRTDHGKRLHRGGEQKERAQGRKGFPRFFSIIGNSDLTDFQRATVERACIIHPYRVALEQIC
jgi:hypothetical protein